ncbi:MAG TPA: DUF6519 domain-containing protein [Kofleriaceae bacterium]|nr:DUF6519 domain-containing protein [Kofleriaceae bacterium]
MKGDFSRITFDAANHFSRVLTQQGRVTLDADSNEQAAILLHYVRTLARDLIGPSGGPADALGFQLSLDPSANPKALKISAGRYYVDGILCENEADDYTYHDQPDYAPGDDDKLLAHLKSPQPGTSFWLYLDIWERHLTPVEDDRMREVALGGPDTCTRAKVVWQVKALELPSGNPNNSCTAPLAGLSAIGAAEMAAELDPGHPINDPCVVAPDARYRGAENQLYRVEIHRGSGPSGQPTFKWSRDNGSVASAWLRTEGNDLLVASARGFSAGAWIELTDDQRELRGEPGVLVKLASVDGNRLRVDPGSIPTSASLVWAPTLRNPKVRRWDQIETDDITLDDGAIPISEVTDADLPWIHLEDGLRVRFQPTGGDKQQYRSGDYWLIPARVATGDIEWPRHDGTAQLQPPHGIEHHYAPLGVLRWKDGEGGQELELKSCLCLLDKINPCQRSTEASVLPRARPARPRLPAPQPTPAPAHAPAPARPQPSGPRSPGSRPK